MPPILFEYQLLDEEDIREHIRNCEGLHVQQVVYSPLTDSFTQICFTERIIRCNILWEDSRFWKAEIV